MDNHRNNKRKCDTFYKICSSSTEMPIPIDVSASITKLREVSAWKSKRASEQMSQSIKKTKQTVDTVENKFKCAKMPPIPATSEDLKIFSQYCGSSQMSRYTELDIKKMIQARGLEETYPALLAEMMDRTRKEYCKIIKYAGMNLKIKNCFLEARFKLEPYKYVGITDRYPEYLTNRKRLERKWVLHCPITKKIFTECVMKLPYELFHLKFDTVMEISEIKYILKDIAQRASQIVYEFYIKITSLVNRVETNPRRRKCCFRYIAACTGILSVHISRAIAHSLLHIVNFTESRESAPYLQINVSFDNGLHFEPTTEDVIAMYNDFIEKILDIGRERYALQRNKVKGFENKHTFLCITKDFIFKCKDKIRQNIHTLYEPIIKYLNDLRKQFLQIHPDINSIDFIDCISDIVFKDGCEKTIYYRDYLNKVSYIPDREFFKIGQLSLKHYRVTLHEGLKDLVKQIFQKLCYQHLWEVNDLCETFKIIHTKATQQPLTTEELIETGKYITWIKSEHLDELNQRVENSLVSLCQIIDLGFLTEEHMDLNADAINWMDKISPVVEEHLTNLEQRKFDAEENLQKIVEEVIVAIKEVYPLLVILDDMDDISRVKSYLRTITLHMSKIKQIKEQISWINKEEVCLSFPTSNYIEYENLKNYVYPFHHLLKLCLDIQRHLSVWQDGPFETLNYEVTKSSTDNFYIELAALYKSYRKKLRQAQDENLPVRFKGTVDDPDILNWPAPLKLCGKAMKLIDEFKSSVEVMRIICNSSLRKRHWKAMSEIAGLDITPNAGTTLRKIMKVDFHANLDEYEIISTGATKEKQLIDNLEQLEHQWEDIEFNVTEYTGTKVIAQLDDIEATVEDHSIKILNMKASVFVKPHEAQVAVFYGKIQCINQVIHDWNKIQNQWIRLLPIFSSSYLSKTMPKETVLFDIVRTSYNSFMDQVLKTRIVMEVVQKSDVLENIKTCLTQIEVIYKGVVAYLETKRNIFPRFYFLVDDELLQIISDQDKSLKSKAFLKKMFQGISEVHINESDITGMQSTCAENVKFVQVVDMSSVRNIEDQCLQIMQQMVASLKYCTVECNKRYKRTTLKAILPMFPLQVIKLISQVYWTENITTALVLTHNIKLRIYYQKLQNSVRDKIKIISENDIANLDRIKLKSLIINDFNYRYLVGKILDTKILCENHFEWETYAKYYLHSGGLCTVRMMNVESDYQYEYLGNSDDIILTPLTDRCYRTLINAYYSQFSGLLQGPSDTGKSETIKSLAAVFGIYFLSFNCPQKLNSSIIARYLKGSALCGSWLCLENIADLHPNTLSVVSQDVHAILTTIKEGSTKCFIRGTSINVKPSCFLCACVNTKHSYTKFPENFKILFRSMSMISPDIERIVETTLHGFGFQCAKDLSKKVILIYNTLHDILMYKTHYNFGLNTLKDILTNCEKLKLSSIDEEDCIGYNSINSVLMPSLTEEDAQIFTNILKDVFPNSCKIFNNKSVLKQLVINYSETNNLQINEGFSLKAMDTYDCLEEKSGVILIGDTFTGKTTILNICKYIFNELEGKIVLHHVINPNFLDYEALYGRAEAVSSQWTDGVVSKIVRNFSEVSEDVRKWLIVDGNFEASSIENINSIINNEKKFHLESGETLIMKPRTSVIFEVKDLNTASPSTVSLCGLVYFHPSALTWKSLVKSWINRCTSGWVEGYGEFTIDIFNWIIPPCLRFIQNNCKQFCHPNEINLVENMIHVAWTMLDEAFVSISNKDEDPRNLSIWVQAALILAGTIGLGSLLDTDSKHKFDEFYRQLWKAQIPDSPYPESFEKLEVIMPQDGLLFDYQFFYKQRGIWKLYHDLLKNENIIESRYMFDFVVPTVESLRYNFLLSIFIERRHPTLLIGPSGTGKSLLIENILINKLDKIIYEESHIDFNRNINPQQIQTFIMSKLNKGKSGFYSPPQNKNLLLFIDNMNLNPLNQYGSSRCLELLRQHLDHKVWYDLKYFTPIQLDNINFISAMRPMEGSNKKLCKRFLRHFSTFAINELGDDTISRIYTKYLTYIWKKAGFPGDINNVITQIVSATLSIYKLIIQQCKPTIVNCHYLFNLRNFDKVIRICSGLKKETYDANKKIYINLWSHEVLRVFGDRLNRSEHNWLVENIKTIAKEELSEQTDESAETDKSGENDYIAKLIFGTFNDRCMPVNSRRYEEVVDLDNLIELVNNSLKIYNNSHTVKLDLILFSYALDKLFKICRIFSMSPGNALLLGSTGSGRQSITKLSSLMYNQKVFQPIITNDYTLKDWNKEFKLILRETGGLEKQCVFLITEKQLLDNVFLQNIDYILRNGEIPDLFDIDEKQDLLELVRLSAQGGNRNLDISSSSVFLYFKKLFKENLHLVLCLNIDDYLRRMIRQYPSLLECNIILFEDWPDEALKCVAQSWIKDTQIVEEIKEKIVSAFTYFHRDAQSLSNKAKLKSKFQVHVSEPTFMHLIKVFREIIGNKQNYITSQKKRYLQGLAKLSYASNQILNMQKALAEYQPQLEEMTQKTIEMAEQISLETVGVENASELVRKDEDIASKQATIAQILKSECEAELAQAIPILEDAISALNTLKPSDITLVKSMKNPPDAIKLVMAAVCVIKDVKPERLPDPGTGRKIIDYWGPSKRILGDMNFLQSLKDFDKDHIKPEIMAKIRKEYLPHKDFKPQVVAKASSAAEGLCQWIIAMDMYDKVAKEVAPKKEKLGKAEMEYAGTMAILNEKKEEVMRIEAKLADLQVSLAEATVKQIELQKEVDYCNRKLGSAEKLISDLCEEKSRWTEEADNLGTKLNILPGDILLCSGVVAYLATYDNSTRENIIAIWHKFIQEASIPCSQQFDIIKTLTTEKQMEYWCQNRLPRDTFFLVNVIIKEYSTYHSVFIDPQYLASKWVQQTEKNNFLTFTSFFQDDYLEKIKTCILLGKPILIHKIKEYIPPCLNELLSKQTYIDNDEVFVKLNQQLIKLDSNFRLYMVCNLSFPYFPPFVYNKITLINFAPTEAGLEEDFLEIAIDVEKPELKKPRKEVKCKNRENRAELVELEGNILNTLCDSDADILEDEASIKILIQSKELSKAVLQKQEESKQIEKTINEFKRGYISIAKYAAYLFNCVSDLNKINYMYQFPLHWYADIYFRSVLNSEKSEECTKRCQYIRKCFTYELYINITHSLFQKDKLTFLFILTTRILLFDKLIGHEELDFFCNLKLASDENLRQPIPKWICEKIWQGLLKLEALPIFTGLTQSFHDDESSWKSFFGRQNLDLHDIPSPWNMKLDNFRKIILLKIIRMDQLLKNIKTFISIELGEQFVQARRFNITDTYNTSYSLSPILIILTPTTNAMKCMRELVTKKQMWHRFYSLCLGDDETIAADNMLEKAMKQGAWVFLQNCHLVPNWLQTLVYKLVEMDCENTHEDFRLWLTGYPMENIPIELLQISLKVIDDTQEGLKENLAKLYNKEPISNSNFFSACPGKQKIFARLVYGVTFFHCVLQEKRNHGVISYNVPYIFSNEDLNIVLIQLQRGMNDPKFSPDYLDGLRYMIGQCHYGGLLENERDVSLLIALLKDYINTNITKCRYYLFNETKLYGLPTKNDYKDYLLYIDKLPEDNPEVFGLNDFVVASSSTIKSQSLINSLIKVLDYRQPTCTDLNETHLITSVDDILRKLPNSLEVERNFFSSLNDFIIRREVNQYNILLDVILLALIDLKKAFVGDSEISNDIEKMSLSVLNNTVPEEWSGYSYRHQMKLSNYIEDLDRRVSFFRELINDIKTEYWLGAFFFPKSFLCQCRLEFSRTHNIRPGYVTFDYKVLPNERIVGLEGIIIKSLYIIGAKWDEDKSKLIDYTGLFHSFPAVLFTPRGTVNDEEGEFYKLPVYQTAGRGDQEKFLYGTGNFIEHILLASAGDHDRWIKRGVKLVCQVPAET